MATIFIDGFDQYGAAGVFEPALLTVSLPQGGWTWLNSFSTAQIIGSLNGNAGYAIQLNTNGVAVNVALSKTLPNNYTRLIGGMRFLAPANLDDHAGVLFADDTTVQCSLGVIPTSGNIGLFLGNLGSTLVQRSLGSVAGNTEHYLEWDITFGVGAAGGWTVWLDGVEIMAGTGTTITTANSFSNVFQVGVFETFGNSFAVDDVYLFDDTTAFNNAVLLSNPVVLTDVPIAASQTQFTNDGNAIGNTSSTYNASASIGANELTLMPVTPAVACNAVSVALQLSSGSGNVPTAQFRAVVYADASGAPGALLASGSTQTGFTAGELLVLPLSTTPALAAGTQYWIGFINDTGVPVVNAATTGVPYRAAANTFTSGPPATAPAMTNGAFPLFMYGLCSGATENWNSVSLLPPIGDGSSVSTATIGTEDFYTFPGLPNNVTAVYTVSVSGNCHVAQSGVRTFDLEAKSGTTVGAGSNTGIHPTVTYAWYDSPIDADPNTGSAWTRTAADNATYGMKLVS